MQIATGRPEAGKKEFTWAHSHMMPRRPGHDDSCATAIFALNSNWRLQADVRRLAKGGGLSCAGAVAEANRTFRHWNRRASLVLLACQPLTEVDTCPSIS